MSVKLLTSGGGGVVLTPSSSIASDVMVNVPSQNCTMGIQGPAFSAYQDSNQAISVATWTKISINTEYFDTANLYDSVTNYRFTPNIAGYYAVSFNLQINGSSTPNGVVYAALYKNGNRHLSSSGVYISTQGNGASSFSGCVYLNGSTDYIEFYGYQNNSSSISISTYGGNLGVNASAYLVRAA